MNNEELKKLLASAIEARKKFVEAVKELEGKRIVVLTKLAMKGEAPHFEVFGISEGVLENVARDVSTFHDGCLCNVTLTRRESGYGSSSPNINFSSRIFVLE